MRDNNVMHAKPDLRVLFYIDWAASLDDSGILPTTSGEPSSYLIPECRSVEHAWELIEHVYANIFCSELFAWHTQESNWPKNRSFIMFKDWFDVTIASVVIDLCEGVIVDDDDV